MRYPATFRILPMPVGTKRLYAFALCVVAGVCVLPILLKLMLPGRASAPPTSLAGELVLVAALGFLALMFGYLFWLSSILHVELVKDGILVHASALGRPGRFFPWSELRLAEAKVTHYPEAYEFMPWHNSRFLGPTRLRTGEPALVYVQDVTRPFVYLKAIEGPSLVLQVESPEEFLEMIGNLSTKTRV
jgi:hypothetical protein